ncbi:MAG TPA: hypothetical protein VFY36_11030 [Solirubrobacteraceae bacterium]|nr:hypothetical protein [Solirubrobacteraceae bacterium]
MLILWLAAGLCASARLGDRTLVEEVPAPRVLHRIITSRASEQQTIEEQQRKCA